MSTNRRASPAITPLPIPARALRSIGTIIVFGGSFDPPHREHVDMPRIARDRMFGDRAWLLYVPAARSPHKTAGPSASDADRVDLLRLAIGASNRASVWTDEIDRAADRTSRGVLRPSYTVDTVRRLRRIVPENIVLRLLIGADQAAAFHRWRQPRAIVRAARPLVMLREPVGTPDELYLHLTRAAFWKPDEIRLWIESVAPTPVVRRSSTQIRASLRSRARARTAPDGLDPRVRREIERRALYRDG